MYRIEVKRRSNSKFGVFGHKAVYFIIDQKIVLSNLGKKINDDKVTFNCITSNGKFQL